MVQILSKLSETTIYGDFWHNTEANNLEAGLTNWTAAINDWLLQVSMLVPDTGGLVREANNTGE